MIEMPLAPVQSPFPDEEGFTFCRKERLELLVFITFANINSYFTFVELAELIRSLQHNPELARNLHRIYLQMSLIDPSVFLETLLPEDFATQLSQQTALDLTNEQKVSVEPVPKTHNTKRRLKKPTPLHPTF